MVVFGQTRDKAAPPQWSEMLSFKEIAYQDPLYLFSKISDNYSYAYLLESVEGPKKLAEFSFIGFDPKKIVTVKNGKTEILEGKNKSTIKTDDPLSAIRKEVYANRISHDRFRFIGGAVGYISYDSIRYWETLPNAAIDDLNLPDVEMGIYDDGIVFDHTEKKAYYYSSNASRFDEVENIFENRLWTRMMT